MENNEIYIDGVNVAECGYFCEVDNECSICGMGTDGEDTFCKNCKDNSNCYYKQLQQLKTENESLKENNKYLEDRLQLRMASDKESDEFWDNVFSEKDYPFNKENAYKELKDYYFVLNEIPKIYMEITGGTLSKTTYFAKSVIEAYNDSIDRYYDKIDDLEYENDKYKSCLQEIKEIAETAIIGGYATKSDDYSEGMEIIGHYVLQKISEVME